MGPTSTVNTLMPSLIMERGKQKRLNVLRNGLGRPTMNADQFCFSCEQIFANRKCLEEHACSSASYICSCGTEFTDYKDMQKHSTTHEPGHQVLDHETIRKRRIEKRREEEEKLKRLHKGEVVWKAPRMDNVPSISLPVKPVLQVPNTSTCNLQAPMQSVQNSQVPNMYSSVSQESSHPNSIPSPTDMQNIFAGVGAPTVDLWTLYQPVVIVQNSTVCKFKKKPYSCGKCGQCFSTKTSLIVHHSAHVTDKVSGCIGCGLLLSSKKFVPRFHVCNSPNTVTRLRIITARPVGYKPPNEAGTSKGQNLSSQGPQATFTLQLKNQNPIAASKVSQTHRVTSTLQVKSPNNRMYNSNQGLRVTPSLQRQSQHPSTSKSYRGVPFPSKSPNPGVFKQSRRGLPISRSVQFRMATSSLSGGLSKPTQASSPHAGFTCRVCHIPFETPQLLQRHKCIKAQEFMAQHMRGGKQHYKLKRMTPVVTQNPAQMNGGRNFGVPPSDIIKKNQVMAVSVDKGVVPVNGNTGADSDDDCYIVESGPGKPAEMIYQVTSSVPIKT